MSRLSNTTLTFIILATATFCMSYAGRIPENVADVESHACYACAFHKHVCKHPNTDVRNRRMCNGLRYECEECQVEQRSSFVLLNQQVQEEELSDVAKTSLVERYLCGPDCHRLS